MDCLGLKSSGEFHRGKNPDGFRVQGEACECEQATRAPAAAPRPFPEPLL